MTTLCLFRRLLLVLLAFWLLPGSQTQAHALLFESIKASAGPVLIIRDCDNFTDDYIASHQNDIATFFREEEKRGCQPWQTHFSGPARDSKTGASYEGDAARLRSVLVQQNLTGHRFAEFWLFSGGGDVNTAVDMARQLRAYQATVRIKPGFHCVSACTIAFMGGFFRYMDEGGAYQVHSASSVETAIDKQGNLDSDIDSVRTQGAEGLKKFAYSEQRFARFNALRLLTLFQNTLCIPIGVHQNENDDRFKEWASTPAPTWDYLADDSSERARDRVRIGTEGPGAIQDILMRLEREAMQRAVEELAQHISELGPRATPALHMIQLMYMTSIKDTSFLSRATMLQMGYLTQELKLP